jgi:hypothetical protein
MKIAFIPSAYRTPFFHAVASRLEAAGHGIRWLSPNRRWARWLESRGVPRRHVFDVTRWGEEWQGREASAADLEELRRLEVEGDLGLLDLVQMDPLLWRRPTGRALRYLAVARRHLHDFLTAEAVAAVFGEQTWAFELLTGQVCRALGVPHLMPHTVRIPDRRFGFFDGYRDTGLVPLETVGEAHRREAATALEEFRRRRPQPGYMALDRTVLQPNLPRLRLLARHVADLAGDRYDETSRRPLGMVADHAKRWYRERRLKRWKGFERPRTEGARPFVLFLLHRQPESSIDVKGSPFTNQIEVVRTMVRTLPVTHELWVKEHQVALPLRPPGFLRELSRLPGVRVLDPDLPVFPLLERAELVVAITGTAAYEAALLGRPAATLAPVFFERVVAHPRFDPFHDSLDALLARGGGPGETPPEEFLAWLLARTVPGIVGDALWQPHSMTEDNLDLVADGFLALLARYPDGFRT